MKDARVSYMLRWYWIDCVRLLTIMMLLFKNFPQDEPIIIIIFDNRQIELHYHSLWLTGDMLNDDVLIAAHNIPSECQTLFTLALYSRFSCRTLNIRFWCMLLPFFIFFFFNFCEHTKNFCHSGFFFIARRTLFSLFLIFYEGFTETNARKFFMFDSLFSMRWFWFLVFFFCYLSRSYNVFAIYFARGSGERFRYYDIYI